MMDRWLYEWLLYLDRKLNLILARLPDPARLADLRDNVTTQTASLQAAVDAANAGGRPPALFVKESTMPSVIDDLVQAVAAEKTVVTSAVVLISGFKQRLADGIAAALAGGATAAELAPLAALKADVDAQAQALADAVAANTPAAPPTP